MFDPSEKPDWRRLLRPLVDASTALGRLALALEETSLHRAWVWRETARASVKIVQIAGHRAQIERLTLSLAGAPLDPAEDPGLAAARRLFLEAAPLFRANRQADSNRLDSALTEPLWGGASEMEKEGRGEGDRLLVFARDLARGADLGARPALLDLLLGLRRSARARRLPACLLRFALPLALHEAGLIQKPAPGLIGGRLPLGLARSSDDAQLIGPWLGRSLFALADEARASGERLAELSRDSGAWRDRLAEAGLRRHARAPKILDLLAATPALSASLAARHLGCSPQAAGAILRRLEALGVVREATVRSRWKIYLAADLALPDPGPDSGQAASEPLSFSKPAPAIDRAAIERTLDELFRDLERLEKRTHAVLAGEGAGAGGVRRKG